MLFLLLGYYIEVGCLLSRDRCSTIWLAVPPYTTSSLEMQLKVALCAQATNGLHQEHGSGRKSSMAGGSTKQERNRSRVRGLG